MSRPPWASPRPKITCDLEGYFPGRISTIHISKSSSNEDYEAILLILLMLEEVLQSARRDHRKNVVGIDANAVIGTYQPADDEGILGIHSQG